MAVPVSTQTMNKSRLRWQCRRGMRELDDLLTRWLDEHYDSATEADKSAFHALLELPDPELVSYLLNRQLPAPESIARIVQQVLGNDPG